MEFICWLIFIKIVLQVAKKFKKINKKEEIKKDCNKEDCGKKDCDKKDCNN